VSLISTSAGQPLPVTRGEIVVCIVANEPGPPSSAVIIHTDAAVPVIVCDAELTPQRAIERASPADVVLLAAGCVPDRGWLERLAAAANADGSIATASAVVRRARSDEPAPPISPPHDRGSPVRPRLTGPAGPCVYLRRGALELVGGAVCTPDGAFAPAFLARCELAGLGHVLAADVIVSCGEARIAGPGLEQQSEPVRRRLRSAARTTRGLSVVVDARCLAGPTDGTTVHVIELLAALGRSGHARVTALVPGTLSPEAEGLVARLPNVRRAVIGQGPNADAADDLHDADVVHRPYQVSTPADLAVLSPFADRLIVTHQDLISYHNGTYFASADDWAGYRALTRRALAAADHVVFPSAHARDDALGEALVEHGRATVIHHGVDHLVSTTRGLRPAPPPGAESIASDEPMLLCLGTDYAHKQRPFAVRVAAELRRRHGWRGTLVLAGPAVRFGSSRGLERAILDADPALARSVLSLDAVSEAEKLWLLQGSALILYPTVHEGFGFIPFEAAAHGVPCLWAAGTSMSEVLPDRAAAIVTWDAAATADAAITLIGERSAADANIAAVTRAAETLRWDDTAQRLVQLYGSVCDAPPSPLGALERSGGLMQAGLSEDAIRLVGPDGALAGDLERPLLALASHPRAAAPVFGALRLGYRLARQTSRRPAAEDRRRGY
jgi:glycosyltransferase involved in cell wall biosynthesis